MFGPHDDNGLFWDRELPIVLPDEERAWQDMRSRLDERPIRRSMYWLCVSGAMVLALGFAWLRFPAELAGRSMRGIATGVVATGAVSGQPLSGESGSPLRDATALGAQESGALVHGVLGHRRLVYAAEAPDANLVTNIWRDGSTDGAQAAAGAGLAGTGVDTAKVIKQEASALHKSAAPVELQEDQHMLLLMGLEWAAQVPTANAGHYFTGTTGRDQFYRLLIPAVWMQVQSKRSLLEIAFAPSFSKLIPSRTFSEETNSFLTSDSSVTTNTRISLDKLFGMAASMNYAAIVGGNWWAGGGVRADWWKHAVVTASTVEDKSPLTNPTTMVSTSYSAIAPLSRADWSNFSRFQLDLSAQLLYKTARQQVGLRISMPFTPLSKNGGAGDSFRAELFYRLALFGGKMKIVLRGDE